MYSTQGVYQYTHGGGLKIEDHFYSDEVLSGMEASFDETNARSLSEFYIGDRTKSQLAGYKGESTEAGFVLIPNSDRQLDVYDVSHMGERESSYFTISPEAIKSVFGPFYSDVVGTGHSHRHNSIPTMAHGDFSGRLCATFRKSYWLFRTTFGCHRRQKESVFMKQFSLVALLVGRATHPNRKLIILNINS